MLPQFKERKPPKICLPLEPPAQRKKIWTGKSKALADAVGEEVNFFGGLVSSNEKKRTDTKLENARIKQEIADMKQEIADMNLEKANMKAEINTLTFGLQRFTNSDDEFDSTLVFQVTLYKFLPPSATQLNYCGSDNTENRHSTL